MNVVHFYISEWILNEHWRCNIYHILLPSWLFSLSDQKVASFRLHCEANGFRFVWSVIIKLNSYFARSLDLFFYHRCQFAINRECQSNFDCLEMLPHLPHQSTKNFQFMHNLLILKNILLFLCDLNGANNTKNTNLCLIHMRLKFLNDQTLKIMPRSIHNRT